MSTLTVTLPPETERKLREKATTSGLSFERYIENRLGELAENDPAPEPMPGRMIDEILAPVRAGFEASGMTEDELADLFRDAREEAWQERHRTGNNS